MRIKHCTCELCSEDAIYEQGITEGRRLERHRGVLRSDVLDSTTERRGRGRVSQDGFVDGVMFSAQFVALAYGQDSIAEGLLRESGYDQATLLRSQRRSGFESRKMCPLIRETFRLARAIVPVDGSET